MNGRARQEEGNSNDLLLAPIAHFFLIGALAVVCSWLDKVLTSYFIIFPSSRLWHGNYRRRMGIFGWYVTSCRHPGIGTCLLICIPMAAAADAAIVNGIIHQLDRYYVVESPQWRGKRR